jgi:hypothetical protein
MGLNDNYLKIIWTQSGYQLKPPPGGIHLNKIRTPYPFLNPVISHLPLIPAPQKPTFGAPERMLMKQRILLPLVAILLLTGAASQAQESSLKITPLFDLRIRQEVLDGVLYFTPVPDRQWIRFRTRAGLKVQSDHHGLTLRLTNEHRRFVVPEPAEFDWDELIIDQAIYSWTPDENTTLTLGRQNIIWDDGFLVLEGHPLDGSRSIYMDGIRLRTSVYCEKLDIFAVHNNKRDPYVLAGDLERSLSDADETGVGAKLTLLPLWM